MKIIFALLLCCLPACAQVASPAPTYNSPVTIVGSTDGAVDLIATGVSAAAAPVGAIQLEAPNAVVAYRLQLPATAPTPGNNLLSCTSASPSICSWVAGTVSTPPVVVATPQTATTLIGHTYAGSSGAPAMNTIGANVILVCGGATTPTDSDGNTYVPLYSSILPGYATSTLYAAWGPKTSTADHFIFAGGIPLVGAAFSGVAAFDQSSASKPGYSNTILSTGSITPTKNGELIFSCLAGTYFKGNTTTATPGTVLDTAFKPYDGMTENGVADAYQIQTAAVAVNTTFTTTADNGIADLQVSF